MENVILEVADGTQMNAYVARSSQGVTARGIIVLQEAFGVNDYIRRIALRFADFASPKPGEGWSGYLAIAPELFHRTAPGFDADYVTKEGVMEQMSALTDDGLTADMKTSFDWLVEQGIPKNKIAVIGFCMGGRAAFLANATLPVFASVSFYGGGIAPTLLSRASELHAPQLLIWGGQDAHISSEQTRAVADALTAARKPFVEKTFPDAGHGFACDARDSYHAPSASEAWALTDEFLETNLK